MTSNINLKEIFFQSGTRNQQWSFWKTDYHFCDDMVKNLCSTELWKCVFKKFYYVFIYHVVYKCTRSLNRFSGSLFVFLEPGETPHTLYQCAWMQYQQTVLHIHIDGCMMDVCSGVQNKVYWMFTCQSIGQSYRWTLCKDIDQHQTIIINFCRAEWDSVFNATMPPCAQTQHISSSITFLWFLFHPKSH